MNGNHTPSVKNSRYYLQVCFLLPLYQKYGSTWFWETSLMTPDDYRETSYIMKN